MPTYDQELLKAAHQLLARRSGQRGKLPEARVRRSISTSYYALFHFLIHEAGLRLLGSENDLRKRRRIFTRMFSHEGINKALGKVKGKIIDKSIEDFMRGSSATNGRVPSPLFVQDIAKIFIDARTKREDADYDLNARLSELDARLLLQGIEAALAGWRSANTSDDRDVKHALCMMLLMKGELRKDR